MMEGLYTGALRDTHSPPAQTETHRQVEMDSAVCARSVETVATMTVRQFPPRLSRSTEVIIELRYCDWWVLRMISQIKLHPKATLAHRVVSPARAPASRAAPG